MITEAWTPSRAASRLTHQLDAFVQAHGCARFPVDVVELALEAGNLFHFPDPIIDVQGAAIPGFEGALIADGDRKEWLLLYNDSVASTGRIRFTQAHELGHYLLHRLQQSEFQCMEDDMLDWTDGKNIEIEADSFASQVLMPLNDFREQVRSQKMTLELMAHCASRYDVSLTSCILKWLESTEESAIFVKSTEGYINWSISSARALKSGAYYKTKGKAPLALPAASLAADPHLPHDRQGRMISSHVWFPRSAEKFDLREMKISADNYDATFTLLLLPRSASAWPERDWTT